jgi:hypothetical protein
MNRSSGIVMTLDGQTGEPGALFRPASTKVAPIAPPG